LKKLAFGLLLASIALAMVVTRQRPTDAATSGVVYTSKYVPITIVITPSPIAYAPVSAPGSRRIAVHPLVVPQLRGMLAYDPFRMPDVIAQATPPEGNVKVNFTVKVDPTAAYLHIIPENTTLDAGYGPNTWTCVYEVYAHYPSYPWYVDDMVQGSTSSGAGGANNGFPTYNHPTTSLLEWEAETITTSFAAFANAGVPGQTAFTGAAGATKTVCFDLSLDVPATIAAGTYQTTIQYSLYVEL
jgi:hypothetical protein